MSRTQLQFSISLPPSIIIQFYKQQALTWLKFLKVFVSFFESAYDHNSIFYTKASEFIIIYVKYIKKCKLCQIKIFMG